LEKKFQLWNGQCRRRAAPEKDSAGGEIEVLRMKLNFAQDRFAKSRCLGTIKQVLVKSAVRANPSAEWDVNVEMANGGSGRRGIRDRTVTGFRCHNRRRPDTIRALAHKVRLPLLTSLRTLAAVFFCAIGCASGQNAPIAAPPAPTPSTVFVIHNPDAISGFRADPKIVHAMVDRLVREVTGQPDVARAWLSLVAPNEKIGIKISAAGGELFTTHHEVVNAIVDGLVAAGHSRQSIIVWDRSLGGIKEAGYRRGADGYQLKSISPREGYDPNAIFSAPMLGKLVWGDLEYKADPGKSVPLSDIENTSNISHFCRILSSEVTKVINVPVMSSTETNGIAGCLYNVTIPNIDNWRRFSQLSGFGAASIAELYSHPLVGKKVVLNLVDGLVAQYAGGPQSQPLYSEHHATLYASKDPVALDAVALKKLEEWRKRGSLPSTSRMASYVEAAAMIGLGNAAPERIVVKNVGKSSTQ
jgi:uncharacterized protein (DUF362 family)